MPDHDFKSEMRKAIAYTLIVLKRDLQCMQRSDVRKYTPGKMPASTRLLSATISEIGPLIG